MKKIYLIAFLLLIITCNIQSQDLTFHPNTPYPIIFVHGLNSDYKTWLGTPGTYDNVLDYLKGGDTPLQYGGNLNITLDYKRDTETLWNTKEEDVHLFTPNPNSGDFYTINFNVNALGIVPSDIPNWIFKTNQVTSIYISSNETEIGVTIPAQFYVGDIICIGNEYMEVTGIGNTTITVNRRQLESTADTHVFADFVWDLSNESNQASIIKQGYGLKLAIDAIKSATGADKVILVGHSMGGLAAREYIRSYGGSDVAKLVTIGTPHLGSTVAELSELFDSSKGVDKRSDALRDLSYTYSDVSSDPIPPYEGNAPDDGVYLFGGHNEEYLKINTDFYNPDVNADGIIDAVYRSGLNTYISNTLPETISYSWIISQYLYNVDGTPFGIDGDICVRYHRQYPWFEQPNGVPKPARGNIITTDKRHDNEPTDYFALLRGLDEPNTNELAYEIGANSKNKGFITYGTDDIPYDLDKYKINLTEDGLITISVGANNYTGLTSISIVDDGLFPVLEGSIDNINGKIEFQAKKGIHYISVEGYATNGEFASYKYPYTLITRFVPTPTPPNDLTTEVSNGQVYLSWSKSATGTNSYTIFQSTSENGEYTALNPVVNSTNFNITGLTNETNYWFYVAANYDGLSLNSTKVNATPTATPPDARAINVSAGGLSTALSATEKNTLTKLTLTGTIDARDFKTMRDDMPLLADIDLSEATIVAYNGTEGTSEWEGIEYYDANVIPQTAFSYWTNSYGRQGKVSLTTIVLPNNLTHVGYCAFWKCTSLSSATIPASVYYIDRGAFYYCSSLSSVTIPASVSDIGAIAFTGIGGLISVNANNQHYSSKDGVLYNKSQNTLLQCPVSKTGNFEIPASVTCIGRNAFEACASLSTLTIPASVSIIEREAFVGCSSLSSITIPASVKSIGDFAFWKCTNLSSIFANLSIPVNLNTANSVFDDVDKSSCTLYIPYGSKAAYQAASKWKDFVNIVEMPGLIPSTNSVSFNTNAETKKIYIASSTAWTAGLDQPWLTVNPTSGTGNDYLAISVTGNTGEMRKAVITLHATGFDNQTIDITQYGVLQVSASGLKAMFTAEQLTSLTKLTLTGTLDARDFKTMRDDMPLLAEIDLSGATIVEYNGYEGTSEWHNYYPSNGIPETAFMNSSWQGKKSLTTIVLPNNLTAIDNCAFYDCININSVTIPASVTNIGDRAFTHIGGLISVDVNNQYYSSNDGVLYNKAQTTLLQCPVSKTGNFEIPASVTSIADFAFDGCSSLDFITIPSSVTFIGGSSFDGCSSLSSVTIPASVTSFGDWAFHDCNSLSSIYANSSIPVNLINVYEVFYGVDKSSCTLNVPSGSKAAYQAAAQWKDFVNILEMPDLSSKSIMVSAGGLSTGLTNEELASITKLTLTGTIDARDFKTMRDDMPLLAEIDLSGSTIVAYSGTEGTDGINQTSIYEANTVPFSAFMKDWQGKKNLKSVILPSLLTKIDWSAFRDCDGLKTVIIPMTVVEIDGYVFMDCDGLTSIEIPALVTSIGGGVFWNCINLSSIKVYNATPVDFAITQSSNVFDQVNKTTCTLIVPFGSRTVYQAANQWKDFTNIVEMPGFKLSANTATLDAASGSTATVDIAANVEWAATSDQTWLTVSPGSGNGNQMLTFTHEANPSANTRTATVTISATGVDLQTITITQDASSIVTQSIVLNAGWNIISANIAPANLEMKTIFQPLIDAGKLKKVMDETGKTLENLGAFGGWKNNIGNLNSSKGYKVNVIATSALSLEGSPVQLPYDIALNAGWNIISYPAASIQDAKALVQSLIDAGKLKKVMDEAGKTIENLGAFGGWRNNIGNFIPGKGYKINVTASCALTIPASGNKSAVVLPELLASEHFKSVFTGNGTDHMNIHLINLQNTGIQVGDEIGIFDGNLCVGSATIGVEQLMSGSISIPASANDGLNNTKDGFTEGHPISLKLFREAKEYNLKTESILNSQNVFAKGESYFGQLSIVQASGLADMEDQLTIKCYPNPFNDKINIEIQLQESKGLEVKIYDLNGRLVRNLYKGKAEKWEKLVWDGNNDNGSKMVPGSYFLKANSKVEKIMFRP